MTIRDQMISAGLWDATDPRDPAEEIAAAMPLMEKLDTPSLTRFQIGLWTCQGKGDTWYRGDGATAPLAICRAALNTVG